MTTGKRGPLWVDGPHGCPIGGPFDLWRKNYFVEKGVPPADSVKMWPGLDFETASAIATATVNENATLAEILAKFSGAGPDDELWMAHDYFGQWRRRAPFMPESMQDLPLLPARTEPASVDETLADLERFSRGPVGSFDEARALAATHLPDGWSTHAYGYAVAGGYLVFGARPDPDLIPLLGEDNTFLIGRDGSIVRSVYVGLLPELRDDRRVGDWSDVDEDDTDEGDARIETFESAATAARDAFPYRTVPGFGWKTASGWIVVTHDPRLPEAYRDEEEDLLLVAVDRDGSVTGGQYLTLRDEVDNGTPVGRWSEELYTDQDEDGE